MKACLLVLCAGLTVLSGLGCQNSSATEESAVEAATAINGAWELMYVERTPADGEKSISDVEEPLQLKVFSDKHFSYVHLTPEGKYAGSSAGTYRLEGNQYVETHLHGSNAEWDGKALTIAWEYSLDGDILTMSGPLSCVDGEGNDVMEQVMQGVTMMEKRRRAE